MSISRYTSLFLLVAALFLALQPVKAQLGYELEIKKPEPYENRLLKAERSEKIHQIQAFLAKYLYALQLFLQCQ